MASAILVYASSSSVYGGNTSMPFSGMTILTTLSASIATKANERWLTPIVICIICQQGLRFFAIYGPWDAQIWACLCFKAILEGDHLFSIKGE